MGKKKDLKKSNKGKAFIYFNHYNHFQQNIFFPCHTQKTVNVCLEGIFPKFPKLIKIPFLLLSSFWINWKNATTFSETTFSLLSFFSLWILLLLKEQGKVFSSHACTYGKTRVFHTVLVSLFSRS